MEHTTFEADRCVCDARTPASKRTAEAERMHLIAEISAFIRENGDILARYHTCTMDELDRIEDECYRLQEEACRRGACGTAGPLVELEYLIGRAKMMRARSMEKGSSGQS